MLLKVLFDQRMEAEGAETGSSRLVPKRSYSNIRLSVLPIDMPDPCTAMEQKEFGMWNGHSEEQVSRPHMPRLRNRQQQIVQLFPSPSPG